MARPVLRSVDPWTLDTMESHMFSVQQIQPNVISVRLFKRKVGGLGFLVKERVSKPTHGVGRPVGWGTFQELTPRNVFVFGKRGLALESVLFQS